MKKFALIFALSALAVGHAPAATAYEALQVVRKAKGDGVLKQLVEVSGETGQPQPQSWTILMADPAARSGIREFVVAGGAIESERTPVRGYKIGTGAFQVLDFARLNLDSDGAFKIANQRAATAKVGFHSIDYTLRTSDTDGAPLWVMHLFDYMGAPVGSLQISAENGKVVRGFEVDPDAREHPVAESTPAPEPNAEPTTHFKGGLFGFVERTSKNVGTGVKDTSVSVGTTVRDTSVNVGQTVKKASLHVAGTVQELLTGERTIDQETPTPAPAR